MINEMRLRFWQVSMVKKLFIIALALCLIFTISTTLAADELPLVSDNNLLFNADFLALSENGNLPLGWYYDAWGYYDTEYFVEYTQEYGTVVKLNNTSDNDARICQTVSVKPKSYYMFSCDIYGIEFDGGAGASISVMDTMATSRKVLETNGFTRVEFIGKTGKNQTELVIAMRIGGYGELTAGEAWFKNPSVVLLEGKHSGAHSVDAEDYKPKAEAEAPNWAGIIISVLAVSALSVFAYSQLKSTREFKGDLGQGWHKRELYIVAILAFILRMAFSIIFVGHSTDISCFSAWADAMATYGPAGFYSSGMFADYPPGYMYVLWVIGAIRQAFSIPYQSALFVLLLKLPAIIADIFSAYIVYYLALSKDIAKQRAVMLFSVVALHPVFAFLSGGWGQIDSLLTLAFLGFIYLFVNDKKILAGIVYGLAILIKPQALMAGPLFAVIYFTGITKQNVKERLIKTALAVFAACAVILILALPFNHGENLLWLKDKYFSTATSYPYASVEAFNLFAFLGGNWEPIENTVLGIPYSILGIVFIIFSVAASCVLYVKAQQREKTASLYLSLSLLLASLFVLGPYMHERYIFPALLPMLIAAIYYNDRRLLFSFLGFSVTLFLNSLSAFYIVDFPAARGFTYDAITFIGSSLTVLLFGYFAYTCVDIVFNKRVKVMFKADGEDSEALLESEKWHTEQGPLIPRELGIKPKLTKNDKIGCAILTVVYAIFALTNLGSLKAPETEFNSETPGDSVTIEFGAETYVSEASIFFGICEGEASFIPDNGMDTTYELTYDEMFRWVRIPLNMQTKTLTVSNVYGELNIREIAFYDSEGNMLNVSAVGERASLLVDEQHTVPEKPSYYNGMYFDELYHARTAYEHLNGMDPYENSHPPLGKIFIMLGIAVFGMNPFGWRIVGALFGVAMMPLFYMLAKRILKKSEYALLLSILFAFDFMHFTQTRIATIDVYAVFFIMLMYYFMYEFYCISFFRDGLKASLKPLALAGVAFALGAATKWICIYAGIGLAVLLVFSFFERYKEYKAGEGDKSALIINIIKTLLWCCVFYILVPVAVYLLSYLPYYLSEAQHTLSDVWQYQEFMFSYHSGLNVTHPYQSAWWQWPFTFVPMWYYYGSSEQLGYVSTLTASGNPAVWWVCTLLMMALVVLRLSGKLKKEHGLTVIFIAALANYLPWTLVTRCTFIYHFFASVPFIILGGGYVTMYIEKLKPGYEKFKWVWAGICVLLFLLMYPGLSGLSVPMWYARILRLLPGGNLFYGVY